MQERHGHALNTETRSCSRSAQVTRLKCRPGLMHPFGKADTGYRLLGAVCVRTRCIQPKDQNHTEAQTLTSPGHTANAHYRNQFRQLALSEVLLAHSRSPGTCLPLLKH